MFNPEEDGKTHINVYSKGKTELGRFLSNFAYSPIETVNGPFVSIEGYWYYLATGDDRFRELYGWNAKKLGKELKAEDWPNTYMFKEKIKAAILYKIISKSKYTDMLRKNRLPLTHYYNYGGKVVNIPQGKWITDFLMEFCK